MLGKKWIIGKIVILLRKVQQKNDKTSLTSPKQYELYLEILFIAFMLGENRKPVTLFPKKSNRFSSFSLGIVFDTWKHYCGACLHLSSVSYLLSLPVNHWKFFCVVKGFFHSFPCYMMSLSFAFRGWTRLSKSTRPRCLGISSLRTFGMPLICR